MKKFLAAVTALIMILSLVTVPAAANGDVKGLQPQNVSGQTETAYKFKAAPVNRGWAFEGGKGGGEIPAEASGTKPVALSEGTYLNGYVAPRLPGEISAWYGFNENDPANMEVNCETEYLIYAGAYAGGKVYGFAGVDMMHYEFFIMDAANYTISYTGRQVAADNLLLYAMAYNHADDTMYAMGMSYEDGSTGIYTVDLSLSSDNVIEHVTDLDIEAEAFIYAFAIDGEGNAYGIAGSDTDAPLYGINLETGECTLKGNTGLPCDYLQSMTWDHSTDRLFWAQYSAGPNGLYTVNPETGEATSCGIIGSGSQVMALWTADDIAVPPIELPDFTVTFEDGYTHETIETITVAGGTVLNEADFPEPPVHEGIEFTNWDYDGHAIYADTVVKAKYYDPNATHLNGYIGYNESGVSYVWGEFSETDPSDIISHGPMDTDTFAAAFAGGNVYGFLTSGEFYIMDADTFEVSYTGYNAGNRTVYAMAYDHANGVMYAFAEDAVEGPSVYTVNLAVGALQFKARLDAGGELIFTLAIDGEGNAYGLSASEMDSALYSIDLNSGECTLIGQTGLPLAYVQGMVWDHDTDRMFWAQFCDVSSGLYIVNPATAEVTGCGLIGGGAEVTGLWTKNSEPVAEITVPEFTVSFKDGLTEEQIGESFAVEAGTILDENDFPAYPEHEGYNFIGWDYTGEPIYDDTVITAQYRDADIIGYYFETDPEAEGWTWEDADGDGWNWMWMLNQNVVVPEGNGCMSSPSYINGSGPIFPDDWLISPEIPGGGTASFMFVGQDPDYPAEPIGVYASTDGGENWGFELGYFVATGEIQNIDINLGDFAGMNIKLAFRHYDVSDQFSVNLDAVEVLTSCGDEVLPEEITVEDMVVSVGETAETVYTVIPDDADDLRVTFAIADENIATVDENGVVTGIAAGETEITVTSVGAPEISGTATVTVTEPVPTPPPAPQEGDVIFDIRNPETEDGLYYAQPGETVTVEFTVTGEYAAHGANINFNYDPELLTIESLVEGAAMAEIRQVALPVLDYETIPGSIKLGIMAPTDPFSAQGVLYTVCFKVAETVELDAVLPLEIEIEDFFNMPVGEEATPIPWFAYNSSVVVGEAPVPPTPPTPPTPPAPPVTGFVSLAGIGIASILAGAGIVLFRRKRS